ncbi:MAG: tetratricopeptide repeat protein [Chitinophagaceae bacterium]|nr:MAG: tetratricopeptide repeat protein [Chitinophagaceae bacterium]
MKRSLILFFFIIHNCLPLKAGTDSLLQQLAATMKKSATYDAAKEKQIAALKSQLASYPPTQADAIFRLTNRIYAQYQIFNYDSAFRYAGQLVRLSNTSGNNDQQVQSRLNISFILLSAGLYKETFDSLSALRRYSIPDSLKAGYYSLWGRYYYDLAGYANDRYHSLDYDTIGHRYIDSALNWFPAGSFEHDYYTGLINYKKGFIEIAFSWFTRILQRPALSDHELALTASTLSGIYQQKGNTDESIRLLVAASEADIRSSTKETGAIFHLAELLYKKGDLKNAALCIENGIANAESYGARQRKIQASSILPLIEGERINGIEAQRNLLFRYAAIVTALVLLLALLGYIILKQNRKLKRTRQALTEANDRKQVINEELARTNAALQVVNEKMEEANKIKEEYIGYFFDIDSAFFARLDKIKQTIDQKLADRRYEDIRFFLNKIDAKKEKQDLLSSFDKIFLKLFPHFVQEVNALLRPDEQIRLKDHELLNTDLRIFALIRMGLTDTEKIAGILEYSVKTIYSYKSKMKHRSFLPSEEFEERVMQIKTL